METINHKAFFELLTKGGISAVLLFIIFYFGSCFLSSIQDMQKDLAQIRVEIVKIQASIITVSQVEKMIDEKTRLL